MELYESGNGSTTAGAHADSRRYLVSRSQRILADRSSHRDALRIELNLMKTICASLNLAVLLWVGQPCYAAQPELIKLTVGYSPISAATLPFFISREEKLFHKHGLGAVPIFFCGSPLIN